MSQIQAGVSNRKMSVKELFSSPRFYFSLFPHLFSLFLIFSNNLGYFYVFLIFYLELLVDNFILSFSVLLMKTEEVQRLYKSNWPKVLLALRSFLGGLLLCLFFGLFATFIFLSTEGFFIKDLLTNKIVLLVVGVYIVTKLLNLIVDIFKHKSRPQIRLEVGKSFITNLVALMIFTVPGIHILLLLNMFVENIQFVAIILLFVIKAYIDSAVAVQLSR
ncbi:MAG: hypothetical protein WDZ85_01675 [Candidatus Paceibacterota bacterium]